MKLLLFIHLLLFSQPCAAKGPDSLVSCHFRETPFTEFCDYLQGNTGVTIYFDESLTGKGFGTSLGIGYSYVVNNHINLEVGMIYNLFYLFGNLHNELAQSDQEVDFLRTQIMFSVAFGVLFDKKVSPK